MLQAVRPVSRARLLHAAFRHFRSHRMRLFEKKFEITPHTRVLDVGGSPLIWEFATVRPRLTILNFPSALDHRSAVNDLVAADGRMLPFRDKTFDIVFSNSVIEHVGTRADQQQFADEVRRVGRSYWIQTPNRLFPVELHLMLPFVHYLPKRAQQAIVTRFTVWQYLVEPSEAERESYIHHFLHELNLLDRNTLQCLFPGATILTERAAGFPKSLVAMQD
ncbi:MAG TPA: methyltransferase domain-containing protein [Bryobacteraceae bacterium]